MKTKLKLAMLLLLLAVLLTVGTVAYADGAEPMQLENDGLTLTIPAEYAELVIAKTEDAETGKLFTVSEKASVEAAQKTHPEIANGAGWLFGISRTDEKALHKMLGQDMSGRRVFAADGEGSYYLLNTATDVRIEREGAITDADMAQWSALHAWLNGSVADAFIAENGLRPCRYGNTDLDILLARIAWAGNTEYTLGGLAHGNLAPQAGRSDAISAFYAERLLTGTQFERVDDGEQPDGEYLYLTDTAGDTRYEFYHYGDGTLLCEKRGDYAWFYRSASGVDVFSLAEQWYEAMDRANTPNPDYLDMTNWAYYAIGEDKPVDLFLICPTVDTKDAYYMPLDNEKMRERFVGALNKERGLYEDSARMFAPYYRQASMNACSLPEEESELWLKLAYRDVSAAFAWYMAHQNEGRPIIVAGFSQGANMCYRLLEEYFGETSDFADHSLSDQLVAVYAIGWQCTPELCEAFPQIRPAKAADDFGVVVSFDCEAPEVTETVVTPLGTKAYTINPLNWKTDGTPADRSENLGACFIGYDGTIEREEKAFCGCYIDETRGVLKVTDVDSSEYKPGIPALPAGAFHIYDYEFFYRNLQENVRLRTESYFAAAEGVDLAA